MCNSIQCTLFFKPSAKKTAVHITFCSKTVGWSDHKMERSDLERSDHGTKGA